MKYEEMSDLQINLLVANAIGVDTAENSGVVYSAVKHGGDNVVSVIGVVDYCNNPSDAWPIIMGSNIDIQHRDGFNIPCAKHCEHMHADKNPLRAAMVVFLMMQEQSK